MDFDPSLIQKVPISAVEPNDYNPKLKDTEEYKQVVASLTRNGLKTPIYVRQISGHQGYVIVDGEQRYTAAKELGYTEIYIYNLGEISEEEAKALTIWFEVQVPFSDLELAPLVVELNDKGIELPLTEMQIIDYRAMAEFDFNETHERQEHEEVDDGLCKLSISMVESQFNMVNDAIQQVVEQEDVSEGTALTLLVCGERLLDAE